MAGGNRKKFNKSKNRRAPPSSGRALFVEGGLLADWSSPYCSPSTKGRILNDGSGMGTSSTPRSRNRKGRNESSSSYGLIRGPGSGNGSKKNIGSAIGYVYPSQGEAPPDREEEHRDEEGRNVGQTSPIVLLDTKDGQIVAYVDEGPGTQSMETAHGYSDGYTHYECSHSGLGFCDNIEENQTSGVTTKIDEKEYPSFESSDEDEINNLFTSGTRTKVDVEILSGTHSSGENPGFLSIGGLKIYTQDLSDESDEQVPLYGESSDSGGESDMEESLDEGDSDSAESRSSSEYSDLSDSGSDIDDEVAADYLEGIRDSDGITNADQLVGRIPHVFDYNTCMSSIHETMEKLSGVALREASKDYGVRNPQSGSKGHKQDWRLTSANHAQSSTFDDLILVKDPRKFFRKKKHASNVSNSWPLAAQKSKRSRNFSGEKKKHRKEMIAQKRQERMLSRGVDLQQINLKFQQMILDGVEIFSFQRMHSRDCSQVRKLASIYRMRSSAQGHGRKKFVTVVRTLDTRMPSSSDAIRIEKLIGAHEEEARITTSNLKPAKARSFDVMKASKGGSPSLRNLPSDLTKKKRGGRSVSFAAQPVSFISSGVMVSDVVEVTEIKSTDRSDPAVNENGVHGSEEYGAFELHTTGFGSKMMAKMGYVEGTGLGKDGQGVAKPIEVFQRPKSLGLGAVAPDTKGKVVMHDHQPMASGLGSGFRGAGGNSGRREPQQLGAFEKHTKGVGSRLMAKMGFVEGMGLGRDSQGRVTPLAAVRRPKARGLGAK